MISPDEEPVSNWKTCPNLRTNNSVAAQGPGTKQVLFATISNCYEPFTFTIPRHIVSKKGCSETRSNHINQPHTNILPPSTLYSAFKICSDPATSHILTMMKIVEMLLPTLNEIVNWAYHSLEYRRKLHKTPKVKNARLRWRWHVDCIQHHSLNSGDIAHELRLQHP